MYSCFRFSIVRVLRYNTSERTLTRMQSVRWTGLSCPHPKPFLGTSYDLTSRPARGSRYCRRSGRKRQRIAAVASPTQPARRSQPGSTDDAETSSTDQPRNQLVEGASGKLQATTENAAQAASDFINSPAVAMVCLNIGAALFGSNQVGPLVATKTAIF